MSKWTQAYLLSLAVVAAQSQTDPIGVIAILLGVLTESLDPTACTS